MSEDIKTDQNQIDTYTLPNIRVQIKDPLRKL